MSAVEGTQAPGIDCAAEVGRKAYEVTDLVARAGPILERPLRGQVALQPGDDCHLLVRSTRIVIDGVRDVFRVLLEIRHTYARECSAIPDRRTSYLWVALQSCFRMLRRHKFLFPQVLALLHLPKAWIVTSAFYNSCHN